MCKRVFLICLCITMVLFFTACHAALQDSQYYFYKINQIIKDEEFDTAKVDSGKIQLYDDQQNLIREVPFDGYDKGINLLYARKEGPAIFFVTSGAVDDEQGILFINSSTIPVSILDGIQSLERLGGNVFQYDTVK